MLAGLFRKLALLMVLATICGVGVGLLVGDGCGLVERSIRAGLGTWDMWDMVAVSPYKQPLRQAPSQDPVPFALGVYPASPDSVPSVDNYISALTTVRSMPDQKRREQTDLAYRRYCHHCHGVNGDNRIMVGESFGFALPDLRSQKVREKPDREIFDLLSTGTERMIPLAATMTPLERVLAVKHLRSLPGRPSVPFFPRHRTRPTERSGGSQQP